MKVYYCYYIDFYFYLTKSQFLDIQDQLAKCKNPYNYTNDVEKCMFLFVYTIYSILEFIYSMAYAFSYI